MKTIGKKMESRKKKEVRSPAAARAEEETPEQSQEGTGPGEARSGGGWCKRGPSSAPPRGPDPRLPPKKGGRVPAQHKASSLPALVHRSSSCATRDPGHVGPRHPFQNVRFGRLEFSSTGNICLLSDFCMFPQGLASSPTHCLPKIYDFCSVKNGGPGGFGAVPAPFAAQG